MGIVSLNAIDFVLGNINEVASLRLVGERLPRTVESTIRMQIDSFRI